MILKTMRPKPRRFNMPLLRRRAKKMMRAKYKKTIKLSDLDKILNQYIEYGITRPLLRAGKVEIDNKTSIEIVGKKIIEDPKTFNLLVKGWNITGKGNVKMAVKFDGNRPDVRYKIIWNDRNYKGNLIFQADPKLSRRVHEELKNTKTYYRIENGNR